MTSTEPTPSPDQPTPPAQPAEPPKPFHPPEIQAQIDEFDRKLGAALVKNLNRNVLAEQPDEGTEARDGAGSGA
jgi:hypothetical protein